MTIELRVPDVGESIQEVRISQWLKHEGDRVDEDENVVELETEKASIELPSPTAGILKIVKQEGETAAIGEAIGFVEEGSREDLGEPEGVSPRTVTREELGEPAGVSPRTVASGERKSTPHENQGKGKADQSATALDPHPSPSSAEQSGDSHDDSPRREALPTPSARRALREHGLQAEEVEAAGKQLRREDVLRHVERSKKTDGNGRSTEPAESSPKSEPEKVARDVNADKNQPSDVEDGRHEEVVPMSMIRRRIAERLVKAQHTAALLTTYNEVDMTAVTALRKEFGERFRERYGIKLGLMSFFVKAVVDSLKEVPELNAEVRGTDIVYRHHYHIGIAIGSEHGLVVPVIRNAERLSFAEIERAIADFAERANARKLLPRELTGGTFTISNGGIYGSLLSTPIVNPPQSGVLGMHAIQDRPVARDGQVVIRPMMYVALTYDHRIIDGREAVAWLRRVKETIEQPARMLIEA